MNGFYLNKLLNLKAKHALYREDGLWYHNLREFPGVLFDKEGYVLFNTKNEYLKYPSLQIKNDLHVVGGIKNLREYVSYSEYEKKLIYGIDSYQFDDKIINDEKIRILREVDIILRNKSLVKKIKHIYNNTCQICGLQLQIGKNEFYSEVHHIVPLGNPHNGRDILSNMICVCPNHHTLLDFKCIPLDISSFKFKKHKIENGFVEYHNSIFGTKNKV